MNNTLPKWLVYSLGGLLVVFVALLVIDKADSLNSKISGKKPDNVISVSAEGKVDARPDMATVTLGVLSQGTTAVEVKNQNNEKVNKIIEYIKQQGVPEKDITTSQFYFYPTQDYRDGRSIITGYQGNQTVTVKMYGIDKSQEQVEKVLDGSVNSGANEIQGVQFSFKDPDDLRQQARKLAIAKAKEKAQELASEAGLKLGKVISVSENGGYYPGPIPYAGDAYGMGGSAVAQKSVAPNVQPGSQDIIQTMTVVFEIK